MRNRQERELKFRHFMIIPGIALAAAACRPSDSDFSEFSTHASPDGEATVVVDTAHSKLAYGPETVRIFIVPRGSRARNHVLTTKIANDGGITAANITAEWLQPDVIQFCLSGVEQQDKVLKINITTYEYTDETEKCTN